MERAGDRRKPARARQHHRRARRRQGAPDGYTLLFANTSVSVNPSLFKTLPYDTLSDLAPVTICRRRRTCCWCSARSASHR
jgi:tripartite-type tricarboxylate transporter receptor subunit TctC